MLKFIKKSLALAEVADAWRIVPRVLVALYGMLVYSLYTWYKSIETVELKECSESMLRTLIEYGADLEQAHEMACITVGVVGGPTTEQNIFVTGIIGLATAIFAFYVNSGRKWDTNPAIANLREFMENKKDKKVED